MEDSSQAAVTPQGVRDGDPDVLAALVARRGPAVLAFCDAVCEPDVVPRAAAEAFARFRALVTTVPDAGGVDPEAFLLSATRHAAASLARRPSDGRGVMRALGRGTSPDTYAAVPTLLAARADSMLGAEDLERLSRVLERSSGCRDVEAAFRRGERGYRSPPDRPLPAESFWLVIGAMQAAAPVPDAFAPALPTTADRPLTGVDPPAAEAMPPAPDPVTAVHRVVTPEPAPSSGAAMAPPGADEPPAAVEEPAPSLLPPADTRTGGPSEATTTPTGDVLAHAAASGVVVAPPPPADRRRRWPRLALPHGGGRHLPRRTRTEAGDSPAVDHGPVYQLLLPAVAILIALLVMLAIAGVFGGGDPAPAATVTVAMFSAAVHAVDVLA